MNPALVKLALEKVSNPHVLINMVSQRVRQLNSDGGRGRSRPLFANVGNLGFADIALREIGEGKLSFEMPEFIPLVRPSGKKRRRPQHWAKI